MPAVSTMPPTTISLAAIVFAVSRHVTKSAAQVMNRQLMASDHTMWGWQVRLAQWYF